MVGYQDVLADAVAETEEAIQKKLEEFLVKYDWTKANHMLFYILRKLNMACRILRQFGQEINRELLSTLPAEPPSDEEVPVASPKVSQVGRCQGVIVWGGFNDLSTI